MVKTRSIPALITPFDGRGELNPKALREHIRSLTKQGASGFYVGGSSGEFPLLSPKERQRILEIAREEAGASQTLICHIGSSNPRDALALACHARAVGVDMISSVPPGYYPYSAAEIEAYFLELAGAAGVPLLVYNVPALAGTGFCAAQLSALLGREEIGGLKHTSQDLFALELIRGEHPDKLILIGHDELLLPALSIGVDGGIGSTFNILLPRFVQIAERFSHADIEGAQALQRQANRIIRDLLKFGIFPSIKYVLSELGRDCGCCRKPFQPLSEDAKAFLQANVLPKI